MTVGSGAYSIAAQHADPSIFFSYLIVVVLCLLTYLLFAKFTARINSAGFSYSFIYATCGELIAYIG
jgi:APA family basic amino acid/polyamine antiporter